MKTEAEQLKRDNKKLCGQVEMLEKEKQKSKDNHEALLNAVSEVKALTSKV